MRSDFAAFILTHGRPGNVVTYDTLRRCGYTGAIYLIVDDLDKTKDEYLEKFGDKVIVFNKKESAKTFDQGDNFNDMRTVIYARNACFDIADKLGIEYFIQLDDDYTTFQFRFNKNLDYEYGPCRNLDNIFQSVLTFFENSPAITSIAFAQGGDFIGGSESENASSIFLKRKCMNSFFCSTKRPFKFIGRINEDVNTYTRPASTGLLFFTTNQVSLQQMQTQTNSGGMTDIYLHSGTYVKSFYTVMYQPSSVRVNLLQSKNPRLHHLVSWKHTVPMILREELKKSITNG